MADSVEKKVKFIHCRNLNKDLTTKPMGGMTIAYVLNDKFKVVGYATARCHTHDHYVKKLGRVKASGRLNSGEFYVNCPEKDEQVFISECHAGYLKEFAK